MRGCVEMGVQEGSVRECKATTDAISCDELEEEVWNPFAGRLQPGMHSWTKGGEDADILRDIGLHII